MAVSADTLVAMFYLDVLSELHRRLEPQAYLEIGIGNGRALALATCRAVGVDPAYGITAQLDGEVSLFRTTSDEYFARPNPLEPTGGTPFDLAFIDGLHLLEFALRDFIFAERHSTPRGLIVFDDMLPRTVDEAARVRHTSAWTGDVYGVIEALYRHRPDLVVVPLDTQPTGLLAVANLDPTSTVLVERYDEIIADLRRPDPQPVPPELLDRFSVVPPRRFLDSGLLELLVASGRDPDAQTRSQATFDLVARHLGPGFVAALRS